MPNTVRSHLVTIPKRAEHDGPIRPQCPIDCLKVAIPTMAFNAVARAYDAPFAPPATVGDVVGLYEGKRLGEIRGLGSRLIAQIEAGLSDAGLIGRPQQAQ
jgi:hypothetical protein